VSEKEQAQALKLLAEWLAAARENIHDDTPGDLLDRTEKFLRLSLPPESHGQRRS